MLSARDVELDKGDVRKLYTQGEMIAEGNYGTVYKATNKKTGLLVAFKLIENIEKARFTKRALPELLQDDLQEVLQEVAVLRKLSHPNVIQLLGAYKRDKSEIVVRLEERSSCQHGGESAH